MGNTNLGRAKKEKNDCYYTQIEDIERELLHYREHFKDKIIFCNCDDPEYSNFWKYFYLNFSYLGLKKLISTHYDKEKPTYKLEYDGKDVVKTDLKQNGDFRSPECVEILKKSDIVCTNPPFSLFREYMAQLMKYNKKFLIIGNQNAFTYKEIFPLIKENKIWTGYNNGGFKFEVLDYYEGKNIEIDENGNRFAKVGPITWFTNLEIKKKHEKLILYREYNPDSYPKYDNYNAINVNKIVDIPKNYDGIMGVPITFINKYNPNQFEIVGNLGSYAPDGYSLIDAIYIDGKKIFKRIAIKPKKII